MGLLSKRKKQLILARSSRGGGKGKGSGDDRQDRSLNLDRIGLKQYQHLKQQLKRAENFEIGLRKEVRKLKKELSLRREEDSFISEKAKLWDVMKKTLQTALKKLPNGCRDREVLLSLLWCLPDDQTRCKVSQTSKEFWKKNRKRENYLLDDDPGVLKMPPKDDLSIFGNRKHSQLRCDKSEKKWPFESFDEAVIRATLFWESFATSRQSFFWA